MTTTERNALIARVCHEANRAYCESIGDSSQVPWESAPEWQRDSAVHGIEKFLNGASPSQLHQSWCDQKVSDGWVWGPLKDPVAKTHPCLVPYAELPEAQRVKDHLFSGIAAVMHGFLPKES